MAKQAVSATLPLKIAGVLAGLFVFLALMVAAGTPLDGLDKHIAELTRLDPQSQAWFTALTVTELGGGAITILVMIVVSLMLMRRREFSPLLPQWSGFIVARLLTDGLKHLMGRERMAMTDMTELLAGASSPSFPSGHATSAMFVYGFIAYLMRDADLSPLATRTLAILLGALIAAVAASRMLLGVHYLSDVLGGVLSGGTALALAVAAGNSVQNRGS